MPRGRARHASVAVRGSHVFLFGGVTVSSDNAASTDNPAVDALEGGGGEEAGEVPNLSLVDAIDRYDVEADEWATVGRCRNPRQMSSMAVVSPQPEPRDEGGW